MSHSNKIKKGRNCSLAFPPEWYRQVTVYREKHKQFTPYLDVNLHRLFSYINLGGFYQARTRTKVQVLSISLEQKRRSNNIKI